MADIILTDAERRNGWTEETLAAYLAQREQASMQLIDPANRTPAMPKRGKRYSPFAWRK